MTGSIFLLRGDGTLVALRETGYVSEEELQVLLAEHPDLLPGDQIDPANPRRWLLISREFGVPGADDAGDRWAVDHLFLDQDGVPTLVEVKRGSDRRIRRAVIGQMLDYAANGLVYWPPDRIKERFEAKCEQRGQDPEEELAVFLSADADYDEYWFLVKTNLQAGRVRMLFVADEIPPELKRVVEFLNGQMAPAEVLAVEIRQFAGEGVQTLVPRVTGVTAEAQRAKGTASPSRRWNEASFFAALENTTDAEDVAIARELLQWANGHCNVYWGKGANLGSFIPWIEHEGVSYQPFSVWTSGVIEIGFYWYSQKPAFETEARRQELADKLNEIPGVEIPTSALAGKPQMPLAPLRSRESLASFLSVFEWVLEEARKG